MRLTFLSYFLYFSVAVFFFGLVYRIYQYWRTPAPFNIATMPAPKSRLGVVWRLLRETFFFQSLFRASRWTWGFSWLMHAALVLLLFKHAFYFFDAVPGWIGVLISIGHYLFFAFLLGLLGLFLRRIVIDRVRYISSPSDYLMLLLLAAIAISGYCMHLGEPVNIAAVKQYIGGLLDLKFESFPADLRLIIHLVLVAVLLFVFPFSKLLHAPGLFFSPTRNQVDDSREKRR